MTNKSAIVQHVKPWSCSPGSLSTIRSTLDDIPSFRHEPLRDPRSHIRLLQVILVDDGQAVEGIKVQCQLTTRRFTPKKKSRLFFDALREEVTMPSYHAVSYAWGSPDDTVTILVNDQKMEVRRNCEYALKQSAWYGGAGYIWCDAICVDQTNDEEKGHQVFMMGDIYRNAQGVLACVGPHADGSPDLLHSLRTHSSKMDRIAASATDDRLQYSRGVRPVFASRVRRRGIPPKWTSIARLWALQEDANMDKLIQAMKMFLGRDYFSRAWVYQEIVLGRHIILCCGCTRTPLYSLYGMLLAMERIGCLSHRLVDKAWPMIRAGAFSWSSSESESLETLMGDVLPLKCTDARDKVYAVLSMVNGCRRHEKQIYPDYTLDALSLASNVLASILQDQKRIRLDVTWAQLHMISKNLRLRDRSSGLDDAIYRRQFSPGSMDSHWPYLGLTANQRPVLPKMRFAGFQLDKRLGAWRFRKVPLKNKSSRIIQCQFTDFEALEIDMVRQGFFDADLAILLPEIASPGDWCLLPYCDPPDDPSFPVLIVRYDTGSEYKIVGKGLGWRERMLWKSTIRQHDVLVEFGSEDLLVLFSQGGFSLNDFWDYSASRLHRLALEEMKNYLRTGVCGRLSSSLAWIQR